MTETVEERAGQYYHGFHLGEDGSDINHSHNMKALAQALRKERDKALEEAETIIDELESDLRRRGIHNHTRDAKNAIRALKTKSE